MSPLQRRPTGRLYNGFRRNRHFPNTLSVSAPATARRSASSTVARAVALTQCLLGSVEQVVIDLDCGVLDHRYYSPRTGEDADGPWGCSREVRQPPLGKQPGISGFPGLPELPGASGRLLGSGEIVGGAAGVGEVGPAIPLHAGAPAFVLDRPGDEERQIRQLEGLIRLAFGRLQARLADPLRD